MPIDDEEIKRSIRESLHRRNDTSQEQTGLTATEIIVNSFQEISKKCGGINVDIDEELRRLGKTINEILEDSSVSIFSVKTRQGHLLI